jgi:DNA-directed RNA polymerase I, II, and III subunit RPABC1
MNNNSHIISILNSRKNLLNILETRNYDVDSYKNEGINEIGILVEQDQLDMLCESSLNKIYIKYYLNKILKPQNIYNFIEDLFYLDNILTKKDDLIIVIKDEPNDTLIQTVKDIWMNENIYISLINIKRLQFNILQHSLVPKHSILNEKEEEDFKKKYNIVDDSQIPTISYFDPVSLVMGIRPNNIIKIERYSRTSINSIYYRICRL